MFRTRPLDGERRTHATRVACVLVGALAALAVLGGCASSEATRTEVVDNADYSFWPPLPNEPRIQFLRSYRFSSDVERPRGVWDRIVFGEEDRALPIAKPYGVDMWRGRIYVCDITNPAVVILDLEAEQTRLMVTRGVEPMEQPTDIAIAPDGMKYVVDRRLGRIFVFDAEDRHVSTFGDRNLVPVGVAVKGDELFVPDFDEQCVVVLDRRRGTRKRTIGGPGGAEGEFIRPLGIEVDVEGEVLVTDVIRGRLQKFTPAGDLVRSFGQLGDTPGSFVRPKHLAADRDGILYVVDAAFQNVQMFTLEGELLMFFGGPGTFRGSMSLPAGIAVYDGDLAPFEHLVHPAFEPARIVVVTNQFGPNKVSVYALGRLREGFTVEDVTPEGVVLPVPADDGGSGDAGAPIEEDAAEG